MFLPGGPQGSRKTTLGPLAAEQLGLTDVGYFDGAEHLAFHPHWPASPAPCRSRPSAPPS